MTLPPRILVHVGQAKAGSTALQNFLDRNHDALVAQGVLFPRSILRRSNPTDPSRTPGHLDLLDQLRRGETSPLEAELAAHAGRIDTLVLSVENIFHHPESARALGAWLQGRQVEMLAVLRDQISWAQALHYEQVMGAINCATRPLARFVEDGIASGIYAYDTMLERLAGILGAGRLHVLDYAALKDGTALIDRVLDLIRPGLTVDRSGMGDRVNVSVHVPEAIEATRRINPLVALMPQDRRFGFAKALRAHVAQARAEGRLDDATLWMPDPARRNLAALAEPGNRRLAQRHMGGAGFGPAAALTTAPPALADPARTDALVAAALEMLVPLLEGAAPGGEAPLDLTLTGAELALVLDAAQGPGAILLARADLLAVVLAAQSGRLVQAPEADAARRVALVRVLDPLALPSGIVVWPGLKPGGLPVRGPGLIVVAPGTPPEARAVVLGRAARSTRACTLLLADPDSCETGRALMARGHVTASAGRLVRLLLPRLETAEAAG